MIFWIFRTSASITQQILAFLLSQLFCLYWQKVDRAIIDGAILAVRYWSCCRCYCFIVIWICLRELRVPPEPPEPSSLRPFLPLDVSIRILSPLRSCYLSLVLFRKTGLRQGETQSPTGTTDSQMPRVRDKKTRNKPRTECFLGQSVHISYCRCCWGPYPGGYCCDFCYCYHGYECCWFNWSLREGGPNPTSEEARE